MGVRGLWELLSPVGHRVSNDSVRNKVLAVDVSIWITQFVKAMRDAEGAQLRNSHLLGIFRRCVKLLYLSVKPVLVFDGATPALKRKTLSSRRAQREKHEAKLRRLAEKMLLNRIKRRTLDSVIAKKRNRHNLKKGEPISPKTTAYRQEAIQLHQPSDNFTVTEQIPPVVSDHVMSSDLPYEDSDIDDTEISIPRNVNELDDEVLMNLPTKVQAEVFKQVKLEQRARHRENMMQKRQDPTEFSKMQIDGFLRHTALNRKISRVRKVANSKSGASQRIASDSGRNFVLEEEALTGTHGGAEASTSDIECLEDSSPKEIEACDTTDLLASIRARKETVRHEAVMGRTQRRKKLMHDPPYRESGTDWASKVLEGNGGLALRTEVPGDNPTTGDRNLSSHSDHDSKLRLEEQRRLPTKITDSTRANQIILAKEAVNTDMSDDDEWEDGNQPIQHDFSAVVIADPRRSDKELSKLKETSWREQHPRVVGPFSQAKAHSLLTNERGVKPVSLTGPEDSIDPSPQNGAGRTSKSEKEEKKPVPSASSKNGDVADIAVPSSNASANLNTSQAKRGPKLDVAEVNVQTGFSSRSTDAKPLHSSPTRGTLDSREREIVNVSDDGESRNKISTARGSATSPDYLPSVAERLNTPHTTNETSSDIEREEQRALKHSLPVQTEEQEQEPSLSHLETMQEELEVEAREISRQRSLHRGGADSVAEEMYEETRDLIKLFGIPYLEAPMEAEAQCAFLNKEKLVDGVLTEDSDAFLFGAVTVYRQLFAEGRFAEAYHADDIQQSLGLSRDSLIRLAYLLGSDYTAGVRGVGIVNSMEVLEAFPGSSGLDEFREWTKSVTILDKEPDEEVMIGKKQEAVRRRFCWKHRNVKRNWEVREGFPNPAVFEAYINPVIDNCRKRFSWGSVDFEGLANFCWDKFGWERDRFESAVGPLRQQLEKSKTTQRRIDEFFKPHRFARIRSERLQKAVHGMVGDLAKELMATNRPAAGKRKINPVTHGTELSDHDEDMDKPR